jgi:HD superfamily phosphohydrolase
MNKVIYDNIHGTIPLPPTIVHCIDTPEFQRLREVKQLGAASRVYPAATHTRFEHSIGVMHLAGRLAKHLGCNDQEILLCQCAGLLHDVGHGPFSHVFDSLSPTTHEQRSCFIVRALHHQGILTLDAQEVDTVCNIIQGNGTGALYEIVANTRTGNDVDRWDYILRDAHAVGFQVNLDVRRLIYHSKVNTEGHVSFDYRVMDDLYEIYRLRRHLHKHVYAHPVVVAIEEMIRDVFRGDTVDATAVDSVLYQSSNPLVNRLHRRQLYTCDDIRHVHTLPGALRDGDVYRKISFGGNPYDIPFHGTVHRFQTEHVPKDTYVMFHLNKTTFHPPLPPPLGANSLIQTIQDNLWDLGGGEQFFRECATIATLPTPGEAENEGAEQDEEDLYD